MGLGRRALADSKKGLDDGSWRMNRRHGRRAGSLAVAALGMAILIGDQALGNDVFIIEPPPWIGSIIPYIETDKTFYDLGEEVHVLYRLTNLGDTTGWAISTDMEPQADIWVYGDVFGPGKWDFSVPGMWWDFYSHFSFEQGYYWLEPGGMLEFSGTWDMTDSSGMAVPPGTYMVSALAQSTTENVWVMGGILNGATITIMPEPGTLLLLGIGMAGAVITRRRKAASQAACGLRQEDEP